jgi:chromosome partitioning protein
VGASSTGGGASGRGQESTDIAKAKIKAATHMAAGLNSSPNKGMQGKARVAMVGLVITIAQRKGGAGMTTLATQFAVTWARRGARVAALDIDPQGSFSAWVDLRRARLGAKAIGFDFAALPGWRAAQWVDDRVGSVDLVVIDAPPHAETEARIAVRAARLVVVPVQPSPLDLWATAETLKMARDERRRSLVVLNRVPPRSRLTEDIAADLASAGTPIAATRIGNRVALAQAMALGFGVIENARMTPAAAEISALAEEIRGAISG